MSNDASRVLSMETPSFLYGDATADTQKHSITFDACLPGLILVTSMSVSSCLAVSTLTKVRMISESDERLGTKDWENLL